MNATSSAAPVWLAHLQQRQQQFGQRLPSRPDASRFLTALMQFLFPITQECHASAHAPADAYARLNAQLTCLLEPVSDVLNDTPDNVATQFFAQLPAVLDALLLDAEAIAEGDPAAVSVEEVIGLYPGFHAIATYRVAHGLRSLNVPLLPRMLTECAHGQTGIDIHPGAEIGERFFIDHGTGVVIGETTQIGRNVKLYQGVTLGATHVAKSLANQKRHPTIEDNVVIYANATILGGQTVVGHDSVIGGNVWLTESVPPHSLVYHQPEIQVRPRPETTAPTPVVDVPLA